MSSVIEISLQGGTTVYPATVISAFTAAVAKFSSEVTDPKAAMLITFGYAAQQVKPWCSCNFKVLNGVANRLPS